MESLLDVSCVPMDCGSAMELDTESLLDVCLGLSMDCEPFFVGDTGFIVTW